MALRTVIYNFRVQRDINLYVILYASIDTDNPQAFVVSEIGPNIYPLGNTLREGRNIVSPGIYVTWAKGSFPPTNIEIPFTIHSTSYGIIPYVGKKASTQPTFCFPNGGRELPYGSIVKSFPGTAIKQLSEDSNELILTQQSPICEHCVYIYIFLGMMFVVFILALLFLMYGRGIKN